MLTVALPDSVQQAFSSKASELVLIIGSDANCFLPEWPLVFSGVKHLHLRGQQAEGETVGVCSSPLINQGEEKSLSLICKVMQSDM